MSRDKNEEGFTSKGKNEYTYNIYIGQSYIGVNI